MIWWYELKTWWENRSDKTRHYNSSIDYKCFDDILKSYYDAMPCESLEKIFEYSYKDFSELGKYGSILSIKHFADNWRAWGTQTNESFWRFNYD
jgi:hypothetical protein